MGSQALELIGKSENDRDLPRLITRFHHEELLVICENVVVGVIVGMVEIEITFD